jgi:cold shock CspA family protein
MPFNPALSVKADDETVREFTSEIPDPIEKKDETRVVGKIIKVSSQGYGFISSKEIKFTRIFFHWTSLKQETLNFKDIKIGMKVEFTPVEIPNKGFRAIRIIVLEGENSEK